MIRASQQLTRLGGQVLKRKGLRYTHKWTPNFQKLVCLSDLKNIYMFIRVLLTQYYTSFRRTADF